MGNKYIVYETKYGNIKFPIDNEPTIISKFDGIVIRILSYLEVRELQGATIKPGELIIDKHFLKENGYDAVLKGVFNEQEPEKIN